MGPKESGEKHHYGRITNDERFSSVHNDPRFNMPKRRDFKVKLDDRFKASDLKSLKKRAKIDKYGRKIKEKDVTKDFNKYYETKDEGQETEEESEEEQKDKSEEEESEEEEEEEDEDEASIKLAKAMDRARGEGASDVESSSDESSSDESSSDEEDSDVESDGDVEQTKPEAGDPARRFAVVNLDWDHVKSTDLMATFQSFVPASGLIESVYIYPSEFGKERLQKEEVEGPPRDVFKSKKKKKNAEDSDSDSDSELEAKDLYEEDDGKEDYDSKSLRRYQLQRLRYYYAVVTCDSIQTAKNIYDNCDGTEYESTANFFDLRFIPDKMEFDDEPRDFCNKIPSNYKPVSFVTDALQNSKVKLTWDETPAERVKVSSKAFSQREIDDMDFKAYLASDNSDEEDDASEDLKNKYRNLVGASIKIGNKDLFKDSLDKGNDLDMEITFTPGLEDGQEVTEPQNPDEESTIDKLRRKAKERRKARKEKIKSMKNGTNKDSEGLEEEEKEERPRDKKNKSKKDRDSKKAKDDKSKAELELLMLEDDDETKAQHFNMKELVRSEKEKSKKSKHRNNDKIIEDDFKADLNDPRFKEIFTNHDFAIDPSQPQFKNTSTMKKILEERNKRRDEKTDEPKTTKKQSKKRKLEESSTDQSLDVQSLVQKLKRKAHKVD